MHRVCFRHVHPEMVCILTRLSHLLSFEEEDRDVAKVEVNEVFGFCIRQYLCL